MLGASQSSTVNCVDFVFMCGLDGGRTESRKGRKRVVSNATPPAAIIVRATNSSIVQVITSTMYVLIVETYY